LSCPSPRAARKLASRFREKWRDDWAKVRGRVFRAGLGMQMVQHAAVRRAAQLASRTALDWGSNKKIAGLPGAFVGSELLRFFATGSDKSSVKLAILALDGWEPDDMLDRLGALF